MFKNSKSQIINKFILKRINVSEVLIKSLCIPYRFSSPRYTTLLVCHTKTIINYTLDSRIIYFVTSCVFYYVYLLYLLNCRNLLYSHQPPTLLLVGKSPSSRPLVTFSSDPFRSTTARR